MGERTPAYYFYAILEVPRNANGDQIKRSYRRLALRYHPDKNNNPLAVEKFKEINNAFQVLCDPQKRRMYDNNGGLPVVIHPEELHESKPIIDFCTGAVIGGFSFSFNLAVVFLFGAPFSVTVPTWMFCSQTFAVFKMAPKNWEEAREYKNWSQSLGVLLSPLLIASAISVVSLYAIVHSGKATIGYTQNKLRLLGNYFVPPKYKKPLAIEDWVMLDSTNEDFDSKPKKDESQKTNCR